MAKSLSVFDGFCGIYEKNQHGTFTVLIYKYGEPYKLLNRIYVQKEDNIVEEFQQNIRLYYRTSDVFFTPKDPVPTVWLTNPENFSLKDLMS